MLCTGPAISLFIKSQEYRTFSSSDFVNFMQIVGEENILNSFPLFLSQKRYVNYSGFPSFSWFPIKIVIFCSKLSFKLSNPQGSSSVCVGSRIVILGRILNRAFSQTNLLLQMHELLSLPRKRVTTPCKVFIS